MSDLRALCKVLLLLPFAFCHPAHAAEKLIGTTCRNDQNAADWDTIAQCSGGTFVRAPYWFGASLDTCNATHAGQMQWNGSFIQYCDGTTWQSLNTGGSVASALTLTTPRNFSITGDATAPAIAFNGSADVALAATVAKLQGKAISTTAPTTTGQALIWNATNSAWEPGVPASATTTPTLATARNFSLTGDATAAATSFNGAADVALATTVAKLQGHALSSAAPASGQALVWNGTSSQWEGGNPANAATATTLATARNFSLTGDTTATGVSFSGSADVALATTVGKLQGRTVSTVAPTTGQALVWNGTSNQWEGGSVGPMADGTAAAPGLYFAADTNAGLYRPTTDTLAIATAGVERLRVDASGNVGIGTAGPLSPLQITGQTAAPAQGFLLTTNSFSSGSAGSYIRIGHGASSGNTYGKIDNLVGGGSSYGNLVLQEGGGNVGIGTTTPSAKLTVHDETAPFIDISGPGTAFKVIQFKNSTNNFIWQFAHRTTASEADSLKTSFYNGSVWSTLMTILTNGNVGIGTTSPSSLLDVGGNSSSHVKISGRGAFALAAAAACLGTGNGGRTLIWSPGVSQNCSTACGAISNGSCSRGWTLWDGDNHFEYNSECSVNDPSFGQSPSGKLCCCSSSSSSQILYLN